MAPLSPTSDSDELPSLDQVLKQVQPARKVARSRRAAVTPAKGKEKGTGVPPKATGKRKAPIVPVTEAKRMKGRSIGAINYNDTDYELLLSVAEEVLPVAGNGWAALTEIYNK